VTQSTADLVVLARVVSNKNVQIVDVSPAVVNVTLEAETSKLVPVVVARVGVPPQGYTIPTIDAQPSQVRVTGATSLVTLVEHADADVNLTGVRVSNTRQYALVPRDIRGADIRGVRIDPANADIRITAVQQEITQVISIVPQVQGSVADGYNLVAVAADPPAIAISGPLDIMQAVAFISTEPVDAGGLQKDLQRTARVRLPAGVQATRDTVNVRLRVVPAQGEIAIAVVPVVQNLGENLKATVQTPSINARLRGELPTLRALPPGAIKATLNLQGLDVGVHVVNVSLTLPEGVTLVLADPPQVPVVISK
jgi:YbbR domain-containing protein